MLVDEDAIDAAEDACWVDDAVFLNTDPFSSCFCWSSHQFSKAKHQEQERISFRITKQVMQ